MSGSIETYTYLRVLGGALWMVKQTTECIEHCLQSRNCRIPLYHHLEFLFVVLLPPLSLTVTTVTTATMIKSAWMLMTSKHRRVKFCEAIPASSKFQLSTHLWTHVTKTIKWRYCNGKLAKSLRYDFSTFSFGLLRTPTCKSSNNLRPREKTRTVWARLSTLQPFRVTWPN